MDVTEALLPVLRESMTELAADLARSIFKEQLEVMVASVVKDATENALFCVRSELRDVRDTIDVLISHQMDHNDPADWWKNGTNLYGDNEQPPS